MNKLKTKFVMLQFFHQYKRVATLCHQVEVWKSNLKIHTSNHIKYHLRLFRFYCITRKVVKFRRIILLWLIIIFYVVWNELIDGGHKKKFKRPSFFFQQFVLFCITFVRVWIYFSYYFRSLSSYMYQNLMYKVSRQNNVLRNYHKWK